MKIYTGGGDRGKTSLFSGERVIKSNDCIEAIGDVDELTAVLGMLTAVLPADQSEIIEKIRQVQSDLFHICTWLATTPESSDTRSLAEITENKVQFLESAIDRMEKALSPLKGFVLPGGHQASAVAQLARTVCRRAERRVVHLLKQYDDRLLPGSFKTSQVYLNRLSDYLFVLARYCNHIHGVKDIFWEK